MPLKARIEGPKIPRGLQNARQIIREESLVAANKTAVVLKGAAQLDSPIGATATLRNSWVRTAAQALPGGRRVVANVFPAGAGGIEALVINDGAKPHRPPIDNLMPWVRVVLGIDDAKEQRRAAFRISRAISRRGLPSDRNRGRLGLFDRTLERINAKTVPVISRQLEVKIARRLSAQ